MDILITGGCGFIGSNAALFLSDLGHQITVVDSLNSLLYESAKKRKNLSRLENNKIRVIEVDLARDSYKFDFKIDLIINFAALPGQILSWDHLPEYTESNFLLIEKLIKSFPINNVPKWMHISTSSVYGENVINGKYGVVEPSNPYGVTKLAGENILKSYAKEYSFDVKILRLFSVFGPYQRPDMGIYKFFNNINLSKSIEIYGDGTQTRQLTYVMDVCRAIETIIKNWDEAKSLYDIAGNQVISVNKLAEICISISGKKSNIVFIEKPKGDQLATKTSDVDLYKDFGFEYVNSIEHGLEQQWKWMKDN